MRFRTAERRRLCRSSRAGVACVVFPSSGGVSVEKDLLITRRDVVRTGGAALTLATASPSAAAGLTGDAAARTASGAVFGDRSGTGRRQAGDPGIAGVLVSNGCEGGRTDGEGRDALAAAAARST